MALLDQAPNACIFCYTTISSSQSKDSSLIIKKFTDFLTRLDKGTTNELLFEEVFTKITFLSKVIECCEDCCVLIDSYCDLYHQIKCLELKLNWKLDTLRKKIELANKVPTRWINFKSTLKGNFQGNIEKTEESQNVIRMLRNKIVESVQQQSIKSYPRIVIRRIQDYSSGLEFQEDRLNNGTCTNDESGQNSINANPAYLEDRKKRHENVAIFSGYPLIETKLEYPNIQLAENDSTSFISPPSQNGVRRDPVYKTCEICKVSVLDSRKGVHFKIWHDVTQGDTKTQILKCEADGCTAYFLKAYQFREHQLLLHTEKKNMGNIFIGDIEGVKYFQCKNCHLRFYCLGPLSTHLNGGSCEMGKETWRQLTSNMNSNRKVRIKVEKETTKMTCCDCGENRNTDQELWLHQIEAHSKVICLQCGKQFTNSKNLMLHYAKQRHPKFICKSCGKKCPNQGLLKIHLRIHTGEKPHTCQLCGIKIRWRKLLRRHLMTVHGLSDEMSRARSSKGKGQFRCEYCGKSYLQKRNLSRHCLIKHKDEEHRNTLNENVVVETDVIYKVEEGENEGLRDTIEITIGEDLGSIDEHTVTALTPFSEINTSNGQDGQEEIMESFQMEDFLTKEELLIDPLEIPE